MAIHLWDTPIRIRTFAVSYCADFDAGDDPEIKLGVFGDLRMGDRYAIGLIARSATSPTENNRVGRLGKHIVERPFVALRAIYEEIWNAPDRTAAFEERLSRGHSALVFGIPDEMWVSSKAAVWQEIGDDIDKVRDKCMDVLRHELRVKYHSWLGPSTTSDGEQREQVDATGRLAA